MTTFLFLASWGNNVFTSVFCQSDCVVLAKNTTNHLLLRLQFLCLISSQMEKATGPDEKRRHPQHHIPAPAEGPWGVPRAEKIHNPFSGFWVARGLFLVEHWNTWRHPTRCLNHLSWLQSMQRSSSSYFSPPLNDGALQPVFKAEPRHPTKEAHFGCLCSFGHDQTSWP